MDVVLAGDHPGDGKPKAVAFPDPAQAAARGRRVALLPLATLIERRLVAEAVERNGGNWAGAARELGLHRSNLHHLARRLGLRR